MAFHPHSLSQVCPPKQEKEEMFYFMFCFRNEEFSCLNYQINLDLNYLKDIKVFLLVIVNNLKILAVSQILIRSSSFL